MPTRIYGMVHRGILPSGDQHIHAFLKLESIGEDSTTTHIDLESPACPLKRKAHYNAQNRDTKQSKIFVEELPDAISQDSIENIISETPVDEDPRWDCRDWVGDSLARLVKAGHLNTSQLGKAMSAPIIWGESTNECVPHTAKLPPSRDLGM
ncbi:hypothetical protein N7475_003120 [Penicillium sp. IBT 31633x]|nr:hypothetical protein N7475_003120 [Penicillium sp. IBT 31633x]